MEEKKRVRFFRSIFSWHAQFYQLKEIEKKIIWRIDALEDRLSDIQKKLGIVSDVQPNDRKDKEPSVGFFNRVFFPYIHTYQLEESEERILKKLEQLKERVVEIQRKLNIDSARIEDIQSSSSLFMKE